MVDRNLYTCYVRFSHFGGHILGSDTDTKSSSEERDEDRPREAAITLPEIPPAGRDTYERLSMEMKKGIGYVFPDGAGPHPNLGSVDVLFRERVLGSSEHLGLLTIDLTFVPTPSDGTFASVPPSERKIGELRKTNGEACSYACVVVDPAIERQWNGATVFSRRIWVRPIIRLPEISSSEVWVLKVDFLKDFNLDPVTILPAPNL